jgi:hypothetical protein
MSDPLANAQLELACRLGALEEVVEALEDGADIDFGSGTALFVAISEGEREVVSLLVEKGADVVLFGLEREGQEAVEEEAEAEEDEEEDEEEGEVESGSEVEEGVAIEEEGEVEPEGGEREKLIDALMALMKQGEPEEVDSDDPVDAKVVRAFDRMIRKAGLGEPIHKKRDGEYGVFVEGLKWVAAEECEVVVSEFLEMVELVRTEVGEDGVPKLLVENVARIEELSERYVLAEEVPGELLKEYLKERKKQAKEGGKAEG